MSRHRLFAVILVAAPLALLLLLEAALRLAGFGASSTFFEERTVNGKTIVTPAAEAFRRYFPPWFKSIPNFGRFAFTKDKPAGTYRVVVLGESSVQGFPYGPNLSFAGWLQGYADANGKQVEVINLGVTSINSHLIKRVAKAALAYAPDAVITYFGHNEFYGPGGAGSGASSPLAVALRGSRVFQLLERFVSLFVSDPDPDKILLERLAKGGGIVFDSPAFRETVAAFKGNLEAILADCAASTAKPRVIVLSPAANLRGFPPGGSVNPPELAQVLARQGYDPAAKKRWAAPDYGLGVQLSDGKLGSRVDVSADGQYLAALFRDTQGPAQAKFANHHFALACDLDPVRLRAPAAVSLLSLDVARTAGGRVTGVDTAEVLAGPGRVCGDDEMTEYLHPHWKSHRKIAEALYKKLFGASPAEEPGQWTFTDLVVARYRLLQLSKRFLMNLNGYFNPKAFAGDFDITAKGKFLSIDIPASRAAWKFLDGLRALPDSTADLHRVVAERFLDENRLDLAEAEYRAAAAILPDHPAYLYNLLVLAASRKEDATRLARKLTTLQRSEDLGPVIVAGLIVFNEKHQDGSEATRLRAEYKRLWPDKSPSKTLGLIR